MTLRTWEGTWGCVCMFEAAPSPGAPGGGRILLSIEKGMGRWSGEHEEDGEGAVCLWRGSWGSSSAEVVFIFVLQQEGL